LDIVSSVARHQQHSLAHGDGYRGIGEVMGDNIYPITKCAKKLN
jgi:hypothetical protein